jgi:hypothetical protein
MTGGVALLTALTLFACEVESNFEGNDAEVGGDDIAQNVAEDTSPVDL